MSTSLTRSLHYLQTCEKQTAQRCARLWTPYRYRDDLQPRQYKRLRLSPHSRPFSSTSPWQASQMGRAIKPSGKKQAAPSMAVQMANQRQQALREGQIPNDMGLLPDTFIMPRGKNRPSWFGNFKDRWLMEKRRARKRLTELASAFAYRYWYIRPRPRLHLRTIPGIAKDLHTKMYTHFASGNLAPIEGQLCEGMLGSLRMRVSQRPINTGLRWTLHKYLSRPKLMSYKPAIAPGVKGETSSERNGVVQAVVRIHSLQSLQHVKRVGSRDAQNKMVVREVLVDAQGRELEPLEEGVVPRDAKELLEFFVVQKSLRRGKEGPWMVWGTTEETTMDKIRREDKMHAKAAKGLLAKATG